MTKRWLIQAISDDCPFRQYDLCTFPGETTDLACEEHLCPKRVDLSERSRGYIINRVAVPILQEIDPDVVMWRCIPYKVEEK